MLDSKEFSKSLTAAHRMEECQKSPSNSLIYKGLLGALTYGQMYCIIVVLKIKISPYWRVTVESPYGIKVVSDRRITLESTRLLQRALFHFTENL